jgi:hypothetical protein
MLLLRENHDMIKLGLLATLHALHAIASDAHFHEEVSFNFASSGVLQAKRQK